MTATTATEPIATPDVPSVDARRSPTVERLALGLTMLPFVVAAIVLIVVRDSYLPIGDNALAEMQVRDVGHHAVLTGLYSRDAWSHPGPMLFYLLAPVRWLTGGSAIALPLGALAINAGALVGMAFVARRRGGTILMVCTLLACSLLMRSAGADWVRDPWNNHITTLPFALLVFLVWAMTCGERWALPVGVVVASFLAQTHIGFVVLAVPLVAFGATWLTVSTVRAGDSAGRRRLLRAGLLSMGVGAFLWLPMTIDTIAHGESNLDRIAEYFRDSEAGTHSLTQGWRVVSGEFELLPQWLTVHRLPVWTTGEIDYLYDAPAPVLLLLVVGAGVVFLRSRNADGVRLVATFAVVFLLGIVAVARTIGLVFEYRLWWTWVVGMVGLLAAMWCGVLLLQRWRPSSARFVLAVAVAALTICSAVNATTATRAGVPYEPDGDVLAALLPAVLTDLADDPNSTRGQVVVDDGFENSSWYSRSLLLQLEKRGYDARMPPPRGLILGSHREQDDGPVAAHLIVASDAEVAVRASDPGLRLIAQWSSVTEEQKRDFEARVAALDAELASGRIDYEEHARSLSEIDLGTHDPAVAWAVAVFRADAAGR